MTAPPPPSARGIPAGSNLSPPRRVSIVLTEGRSSGGAMGRRLTNAERRKWQERLQVRMPPDDMRGLVDELHDITGTSMLIQAGVEFIRDAWTAARFAK